MIAMGIVASTVKQIIISKIILQYLNYNNKRSYAVFATRDCITFDIQRAMGLTLFSTINGECVVGIIKK